MHREDVFSSSTQGPNMKKTLLLVFIHGFKGDDDTFANFPDSLRSLVARALPTVQVATAVYPKYETRGVLKECVGRFREWLQNQVIDLEVANRTASPTVDPSVHVFLVGHSMGGIVAAETLLLLASEQPIPPKFSPNISSSQATADSLNDSTAAEGSRLVEPGSFMFPHIQGVLAFDTPFLGIAPGVVSYGAEGHYQTVATAYNTISEVAGIFGFGGAANTSSKASDANRQTQPKPLPSPSASGTASAADAAATPSWQRWGRYAMFAGAAGAMAAGGAAAMYSQRQRLTDGWGWVSSHLAFVGCLARPSDLRQRLTLLSKVHEERGINCTNFYTCLGKGAPSLVESTNQGKTSFTQRIIRSKHRTFCSLPPEVEGTQESSPSSGNGITWVRAVNDTAADEVRAHISMFLPKQNPAFYELVADACRLVVNSIDKGWYSSATEPIIDEVDDTLFGSSKSNTSQNTDSVLMDGDDVVVVD
ncbi:esterase/lipase family protein [Aspergillus clavatus NRRL 1]|uniref:DUF676 domain-containing protein n=1 Tax=Aspergillus clavatus (strain ATCC 1007 / CBS 513.65 / DSM 816 / NCTC 3887 / NRRL 1 / QM 1276 / 107) TaxID=344612 RepID=A1CPR9_ASPCL|nr:uncharacterized protein ACLA_023540 [Aspergillus clavatus NRRL 1]EAW07640.1 conserved hypothetical protein [Aspergillus clavatus NRRL 1]